MTMSGNWFSGGFNRAREINEQQQSSGMLEFGNNERSRFWMKPGNSRQIIFLDDFNWTVQLEGNNHPIIPFCRFEHKIEIGGDWRNMLSVTCTKGVSPCKFCDLGYKRLYVGAMTVLDVTKTKDEKTGQMTIRPWKKLFVAVPSALMIIEKKKEKKENLTGWLYSAARHEKKSPKVGNDFEAEEKIEDVRQYLKDLKCQELNLDPYGFTADKAFEFYRKIFAPMPLEQQEKIIKSGSAEDGSIMKAYRKPAAGQTPSGASDTPDEDAPDAGSEVVPY
jgi:hypothetical protein